MSDSYLGVPRVQLGSAGAGLRPTQAPGADLSGASSIMQQQRAKRYEMGVVGEAKVRKSAQRTREIQNLAEEVVAVVEAKKLNAVRDIENNVQLAYNESQRTDLMQALAKQGFDARGSADALLAKREKEKDAFFNRLPPGIPAEVEHQLKARWDTHTTAMFVQASRHENTEVEHAGANQARQMEAQAIAMLEDLKVDDKGIIDGLESAVDNVLFWRNRTLSHTQGPEYFVAEGKANWTESPQITALREQLLDTAYTGAVANLIESEDFGLAEQALEYGKGKGYISTADYKHLRRELGMNAQAGYARSVLDSYGRRMSTQEIAHEAEQFRKQFGGRGDIKADADRIRYLTMLNDYIFPAVNMKEAAKIRSKLVEMGTRKVINDIYARATKHAQDYRGTQQKFLVDAALAKELVTALDLDDDLANELVVGSVLEAFHQPDPSSNAPSPATMVIGLTGMVPVSMEKEDVTMRPVVIAGRRYGSPFVKQHLMAAQVRRILGNKQGVDPYQSNKLLQAIGRAPGDYSDWTFESFVNKVGRGLTGEDWVQAFSLVARVWSGEDSEPTMTTEGRNEGILEGGSVKQKYRQMLAQEVVKRAPAFKGLYGFLKEDEPLTDKDYKDLLTKQDPKFTDFLREVDDMADHWVRTHPTHSIESVKDFVDNVLPLYTQKLVRVEYDRPWSWVEDVAFMGPGRATPDWAKGSWDDERIRIAAVGELTEQDETIIARTYGAAALHFEGDILRQIAGINRALAQWQRATEGEKPFSTADYQLLVSKANWLAGSARSTLR